jgi:hypothetical protein
VPPAAYGPTGRPLKSPGVAGILSLLPGIGHVYLGLYQRAMMFLAIWVVIIAIVSEVGGPIGLLIPFWWFFVLIDAIRQTNAINASGVAESNIVPIEKAFKASGALGLGVFFILVGLFLTLKNFVRFDLSFLRDWWPLLLVAFGAWQVFAYYKTKADGAPKSDTV